MDGYTIVGLNESQSTAEPIRLLVFEDDKPLAEGLVGNPEPEGFSLKCVGTGEAGLVELAASPADSDLLILDIMLPGIDGFEVCRRVRSETTIPVLLLTVKDEQADVIKGLELEFDFAFESGGYQLPPDERLTEILEEVYPVLNLPLEFVPFRSHSDGNLFYQAGSKPFILGPGSLETAHTADEQTSLAEVEAAARIYAALALG